MKTKTLEETFEIGQSPKIPLFVWATISASFYHYGEPIKQDIEVNDIIMLKEELIKEVKRYLILKFGTIKHRGHTYDTEKVSYKVTIKALNRV